jgi:hypothetical protein
MIYTLQTHPCNENRGFPVSFSQQIWDPESEEERRILASFIGHDYYY